jgi:hypothetical protein
MLSRSLWEHKVNPRLSGHWFGSFSAMIIVLFLQGIWIIMRKSFVSSDTGTVNIAGHG